MFYFLLNSFILVYQTALERFKNAFERFYDAVLCSGMLRLKARTLREIFRRCWSSHFNIKLLKNYFFVQSETNFLLPVRR